jgi:hypothetical protein
MPASTDVTSDVSGSDWPQGSSSSYKWTFHFDDPGIDTGISLISVAAGQVITSLMVFMREAWDSSVSDELQIGASEGGQVVTFPSTGIQGGPGWAVGFDVGVEDSGGGPPWVARADCTLTATMVSSGDPPTQGELDLYLFILAGTATPTSG